MHKLKVVEFATFNHGLIFGESGYDMKITIDYMIMELGVFSMDLAMFDFEISDV